MSRFNNLEFGEQHESDYRHEPAVKDEAFYLHEADTAFEQGQFEVALRAYSKVLEHNPQNATAWTAQVRMLIELEEYDEASLWANKALEHFPREPELLAAKAVALGRMGDLKSALAFSDASIEERGDTPYVWLARGDVLLARKEKRATFCIEKALTLAAQNWLFNWLASRIYFYYQKFALALKVIQQALTLNATQSVIWLQMGLCQQALGMAGTAGESFEQALQLDPHCAAALLARRELSGPRLVSCVRGWWRRLLPR